MTVPRMNEARKQAEGWLLPLAVHGLLALGVRVGDLVGFCVVGGLGSDLGGGEGGSPIPSYSTTVR